MVTVEDRTVAENLSHPSLNRQPNGAGDRDSARTKRAADADKILHGMINGLQTRTICLSGFQKRGFQETQKPHWNTVTPKKVTHEPRKQSASKMVCGIRVVKHAMIGIKRFQICGGA